MCRRRSRTGLEGRKVFGGRGGIGGNWRKKGGGWDVLSVEPLKGRMFNDAIATLYVRLAEEPCLYDVILDIILVTEVASHCSGWSKKIAKSGPVYV